MHIESDKPSGVATPQVEIGVTTADNRHAHTPLDYETWNDDAFYVRIKSYDANGSSVVITLAKELVYEIAYGRILNPVEDHGEE